MLFDNKITKFFKKIPAPLIVGIVILIAVIRIIFLFNMRNGHHVDETWSYGYANSYYFADIHGGIAKEERKNTGEWITGQTFKDYISVSEDHRFSFDSVLANSKYDLSPPLFILILHFICSFFPGQFSWWYAFILGLLCYIPSLILIYLIAYDFTDSEFCGVLSTLYYVFSGAGTADFLYLRVYNLFTLLTLLLFWLVGRIIVNKTGKKTIYFCLLPVAALPGCFTHYYYLVIAFAITLFGFFILLFKKQIADAFKLGFIMLGTVVAFFLMYRPALERLLPSITANAGNYHNDSTGYYEYPYSWDLRIANVHFFNATVGFYIDFTILDVISVAGAVVLVAIIFALIIFLFRNEGWMKKLLAVIKDKMKTAFTSVKRFCGNFNASILVSLLTALFYLFIVPCSAPLTNMGFTERYFFPVMAIFVPAFVSIIAELIKKIGSLNAKKAILLPAVIILTAGLCFLNYNSKALTYLFYFDYMQEAELLEQFSGKDSYIITDQGRDLVWLSSVLYDANNLYIDLHEDVASDDFTFPELNSDVQVVIVETGLVTEEQKADLVDGGMLAVEGYFNRNSLMTLEDVIEKFETENDCTLTFVTQYNSFIGKTDFYTINFNS